MTVTTFDAGRSTAVEPPMSTLTFDSASMGRRAAEMLLDLIDGRRRTPLPEVILTRFVTGVLEPLIGHVRARPIVATLVTLALVGCGGDGGTPTPVDGGLVGATAEVHVYDAWVAPTRATTAEVSMRLHNGGPQDDRLLDAACAFEGAVAVNGAVVLAPEEEVVLAPGGKLTARAGAMMMGGAAGIWNPGTW